jgi:hypothetical protein
VAPDCPTTFKERLEKIRAEEIKREKEQKKARRLLHFQTST